MSKTKKVVIGLIAIVAAVVAAVLFTGRTRTETVTFQTKTGDEVAISLETSGKYSLVEEENRFVVKGKDKEIIFDGGFIAIEDYEMYIANAEADENATIDERNENYVNWSIVSEDMEEHNRVIKLSDKTAIIIGSRVDKEIGDEVYKAMTFEVKGDAAKVESEDSSVETEVKDNSSEDENKNSSTKDETENNAVENETKEDSSEAEGETKDSSEAAETENDSAEIKEEAKTEK